MTNTTQAQEVKTWEQYAIVHKRQFIKRNGAGWLLHTEGGPVYVSTIEEARTVAARTGCSVIL